MKNNMILFLSFAFLSMSLPAAAQSVQFKTAQKMSDEEVWKALSKSDKKGKTLFGKCKISDATRCKSCFCPYYFVSAVKGNGGHTGWPKNPQSGEGTGCLGKGCWGGYTSAMCSEDVKANAKAILLDALINDACGILN